MKPLFYAFIFGILIACGGSEPAPTMYFPPLSGSEWATVAPASLGWKENGLDPLRTFLAQNNTRAFLVLHEGKIAIEWYNGQNFNKTGAFTRDSQWYWASAGKTLTAYLVGIAQQDGKMDIEKSSATYLGTNWSTASPQQEASILVRHHLSMSTGLDYTVSDLFCTKPECLQYKQAPNTTWYYHNAPYTLLGKMIENATATPLNDYTNQKLFRTIGMEGQWLYSGYNRIFSSTARSMARFGLLVMNNGQWNGQALMTDQNYFKAMTNTSQQMNLSYGYLWWLNGKASSRAPGSTSLYAGPLVPDAPADLIAGIGANGQFISIVPSKKLVVVRMGESPNEGSEVPTGFHNELWKKLGAVIP